jgi:protein TonB
MDSNVIYSPYGAFELKAKYQRNFALATLITFSFVLLALATSAMISTLSGETAVKVPPIPRSDSIVVQIPPPPSIVKEPPQVPIGEPKAAVLHVGIPTPVPDAEIIDENIVIPSRDELAQINPPDIPGIKGGDNIVFTIPPSDNDSLFPGKFVSVEIYPVMIHEHKPDYPHLAQQAGITGIVIVWAVIDEEGNVIDARVFKSSGTKSLDEAAVQAAYKNKFKPGIQNGRPIKVPVTYNVEFKLTDQ